MNTYNLILRHTIITIMVIVCLNGFSQVDQDKGIYKEYQRGFYHKEIIPDVQSYPIKETQAYKYFAVDFSEGSFPTNIEKYNKFWHNSPLSQGNTGTCWAFAATSFFESEIYRNTKKEIKLSEMYTVYWEYVERAKDFVKTRGETYYEQGSEAHAIIIIAEKYGMLPATAYGGNAKPIKFHTHEVMINEIKDFLKSIKGSGTWNEEFVINTVKNILNDHMGEPPAKFNFEGKEITPQQFVEEICKLNLNDYFSFMSTKSKNFYEKAELVEADNWRHDDSYYNLPLTDYFSLMTKAVEAKQTICICGDVSEPGYDSFTEVAIVPSFDIPSEYINDDARQIRLSNESTTDDHCIHIVGYKKVDDDYWFLIKDSGSGGFDGSNKGYRFYHEDYVKLKMMNIILHKSTAKAMLDKIIK